MDMIYDDIYKNIDVRVIDQRIGAGIGGMDTVIRIIHKPTGILVEVPRVSSTQYYDREIAIEMIAAALTHPKMSTCHD
jgi:protein subunit release factor A